MPTLPEALDYFFVLFHSSLILFVLFGWLKRSWRKLHLLCVIMIGASWFGLGLIFGMGYCPLTDWHWSVLTKMGETGLPASYVQYILIRLTGIDPGARTADIITMLGWMLATVTAIGLFIKNLTRKQE